SSKIGCSTPNLIRNSWQWWTRQSKEMTSCQARLRGFEIERRQVVGDDFKDLFGDWRPDEEGREKSDDFRAEPENRTRRALNEKEVKIVNVYEAVPEG